MALSELTHENISKLAEEIWFLLRAYEEKRGEGRDASVEVIGAMTKVLGVYVGAHFPTALEDSYDLRARLVSTILETAKSTAEQLMKKGLIKEAKDEPNATAENARGWRRFARRF